MVVYGRIQPIIATLATGAIFIGIALFLRPQPGGKIDEDLNWALTNSLGDFASTVHIFNDGAAPWFEPFAGIPTPFVLLANRSRPSLPQWRPNRYRSAPGSDSSEGTLDHPIQAANFLMEYGHPVKKDLR